MKQLDVDYVIPSQGKLFYGANDRIDELLKHHEIRLEEAFVAIGETVAHLEHLWHDGKYQKELKVGKWIYFM